MPRSLRVVIALLMVFGLMSLSSTVIGLTSGVVQISSGLLSFLAAWGLARGSRFWRFATLIWLGVAMIAGVVILMIVLAMTFTSSPHWPMQSELAAMPWAVSLIVVCTLALYGWMLRALRSGPVRRWFEADGKRTAVVAA